MNHIISANKAVGYERGVETNVMNLLRYDIALWEKKQLNNKAD